MTEAIYTAALEGSLKLTARGEWIHNGVLFQNQKLSDLFHRSLRWDESIKRYFVHIGQQRASFDYEDTVFFVTSLDDSRTPWQAMLKDGTQITVNAKRLVLGAENQIYITLENGQRARFLSAAHQQLLTHVVTENEIEIAGTRVQLICEK